MKFQRIRGPTVINSIPFGRAVRSLAHDLVWQFSDTADFGFQDGGCHMFAAALKDWSGGGLELAAVYCPARGRQAQHVVARFGGTIFIDSDGAGSREDLLDKMVKFEKLVGATVGDYDPASETVIPFNASLVEWLTKRMRRRFGAFDPSVLEAFSTSEQDSHPELTVRPLCG